MLGMKSAITLSALGRLVCVLFALVTVFSASYAFAATPTLSIMSASGQYFQINVTGDPNQTVTLYYYPTNSSTLSTLVLGSTNGSGTLTTSITPSSYNIPSGSNVYVIVNGQHSSSVAWPYYSGTSGNVVLSQTYLNMYQGQTQNISLSGGSGSYYVSSNSNPSIASATISGSNVSVYAYTYGSSSITICSSNSSGCATLTVYVSNYNYGSNQQVTVSQSSVYLNYGQSTTLWLSGGNNSYYIAYNTNSSVANTTITGNTLTIYGQGNGTTSISVCSSAMLGSGYNSYSSCVPVYVSVGSGYYGGTNYYNNNYPGYSYQAYNYPTYSYPTYTNPSYSYPTYTNYPRTGVNVGGVLISSLPYTGLAENIKITIFMIGLMIWSAFLAYLYIAKRNLLWGTAMPIQTIGDRVAEFKRQNMLRKQANQ